MGKLEGPMIFDLAAAGRNLLHYMRFVAPTFEPPAELCLKGSVAAEVVEGGPAGRVEQGEVVGVPAERGELLKVAGVLVVVEVLVELLYLEVSLSQAKA